MHLLLLPDVHPQGQRLRGSLSPSLAKEGQMSETCFSIYHSTPPTVREVFSFLNTHSECLPCPLPEYRGSCDPRKRLVGWKEASHPNKTPPIMSLSVDLQSCSSEPPLQLFLMNDRPWATLIMTMRQVNKVVLLANQVAQGETGQQSKAA